MRRMLRMAKPSPSPQNYSTIQAVEAFCHEEGLVNFFGPGNCYIDIEVGDYRLQRLLELLHSHGFSLLPDGVLYRDSETNASRHLRHEWIFQFDEHDWDIAEYLILDIASPATHIRQNDLQRMQEGLLHFAVKRIPTSWGSFDFERRDSDLWECIISDRVRKILESAGILHIQFKPVIGGDYFKDQAPPVLWELDSDVVLPPVSATVPFVDPRGENIQNTDPTTKWRAPKPIDGMWAYSRSALESVGPFDIARTLEPWWGPNFARPHVFTPLLVSKNFYQVCRDNKFNVSWVPVRVEED